MPLAVMRPGTRLSITDERPVRTPRRLLVDPHLDVMEPVSDVATDVERHRAVTFVVPPVDGAERNAQHLGKIFGAQERLRHDSSLQGSVINASYCLWPPHEVKRCQLNAPTHRISGVPDRKAVTIDAIVGSNVRRLRIARGWSQDEVARRAREEGLQWSRSSVAAVEATNKTIDVSELVLLSLALDARIDELLAGDERVQLGDDTTRRLWEVRRILASDGARKGIEPPKGEIEIMTRKEMEARMPNLRGFMEDARQDLSARAASAASGEAEQKAARKFGIGAQQLSIFAFDLWGRSLTEERDARVNEADAQSGSAKSLQALRGHVTRHLLAELAPHLKEGPSFFFTPTNTPEN
jgi:transcriptional regulator with XRE-family HTH domain